MTNARHKKLTRERDRLKTCLSRATFFILFTREKNRLRGKMKRKIYEDVRFIENLLRVTKGVIKRSHVRRISPLRAFV